MEGYFQKFVDSNSAPSKSSETLGEILEVVTKVAKTFKFNAVVAGSTTKHTNVHEYSDFDVIIQNSKDKPVSKRQRSLFAQALSDELSVSGYHKPRFMYQYQAITFTCNDPHYSCFDVVFIYTTWTEFPLKLPVKDFFNRPDRQRAVRALKLLIHLVPDLFPYSFTMHILRLL